MSALHQPVGGRFTVKLTASTDASALKHRLERVNVPIHEAEVIVDASFVRASPMLLSENDSRPPWQYRVLETLGSELLQVKRLAIRGPYNSSMPITIVTKLLQAHSQSTISEITAMNWSSIRFYGRSRDYEEFLNKIQAQCGPCLQEFRLSAVHFRTVAVQFPSDFGSRLLQVVSRFPQLRLVFVNGNSASDIVRVPPTQALFSSRSLQKVVLFSFVFNDLDTQSILQALQVNTSIREASLGLTCATLGGPALVRMLQHNNTLENLWVRMDSLEDDGCNHTIAQALRTSSALHELGLYGEGVVSPTSQSYFVDALRVENTSLQELDLHGADECEELNDLLFLNQLGRRELLQSSSRPQWVQALTQTRHHLSCLFHLLQANPVLFSPSDTQP